MQHCGIYAGDEDSYIDFADVFDPLISEYHGLAADFKHVSDMDPTKVTGNVNPEVPVHSVRLVCKISLMFEKGLLPRILEIPVYKMETLR